MSKDLQEVMRKYTYLVAERLYGFHDFDVKFEDHLTANGIGIRGINRIHLPGYNYISFNGILYSKQDLSPHAWITIVHELTHVTVGTVVKVSNTGKWRITHSGEFHNTNRKNLRKLHDLRKEFNKEVGLKDDFAYIGR